MDKLILKKNIVDDSYRAVNVPQKLYDEIMRLKDVTGLPATSITATLIGFALERVEVDE